MQVKEPALLECYIPKLPQVFKEFLQLENHQLQMRERPHFIAFNLQPPLNKIYLEKLKGLIK